MIRNPLLEEAAEVYLRRREYVILHVIVLLGMALTTIGFWPSHSFLTFFRTETVPAVLQATLIIQGLGLTIIGFYVGLDRLAEKHIIRHSEWIERTTIPIGALFRGRIAAATIHMVLLSGAGLPFVVIAAGPAGSSLRVALAGTSLVFLSGLVGRFAGMLVSHLGERNYVVRVTGGWLFMAVFLVVTIQVYQPLNPVAAVVRVLDAPGDTVITSGAALAAAAILLAATYWESLARHRARSRREATRAR
jgi:hypothetical protein